MKILIAGCNGHVGKEIVKKAVEQRIDARCFDLNTMDVSSLDTSSLEIVAGDITDIETVRKATYGIDVVMDVIGMRGEKKTLTHEMVEHGGIKNIIQAGKENGVKHILYISALGVKPDAPARTLAAKWNAEQTLINSGISYTIFRPSGYFVDFIEHFAPKIRETGSFTVIGSGLTRLQPLDTADLAEAFVRSIDNEKAKNNIFKISGPEIFTLMDIINLVGKVVGKDVKIKKVPFWVMNVMFSFIAILTRKRGGKDFLYRMSRDSVCTDQEMREVSEAFAIELKSLEPWLRERVAC
jgi:NADH dehydrogenase